MVSGDKPRILWGNGLASLWHGVRSKTTPSLPKTADTYHGVPPSFCKLPQGPAATQGAEDPLRARVKPDEGLQRRLRQGQPISAHHRLQVLAHRTVLFRTDRRGWLVIAEVRKLQ